MPVVVSTEALGPFLHISCTTCECSLCSVHKSHAGVDDALYIVMQSWESLESIVFDVKPISQLWMWSITCRMWSHSVTCHLTQVSAPYFTPPPQPSRLVHDLCIPDGSKDLAVGCILKCFCFPVCRQSALDSNLVWLVVKPLDHKSNIICVKSSDIACVMLVCTWTSVFNYTKDQVLMNMFVLHWCVCVCV